MTRGQLPGQPARAPPDHPGSAGRAGPDDTPTTAPKGDSPPAPTLRLEGDPIDLPDDLIGLLRQRSTCYLSTIMPDGSPQLTQTWVDTDGRNVLINTVQGFQKARNVERDPRVAVAVSTPDHPSRYYSIRGRVVRATTDGAAEHIEALAQRYLGQPYPWYGGRDQTRLLLTIAADSLHTMG